jgi:glutaredoxin
VLKIFVLANCPHCRNLKKWIEMLYVESPKYKAIEIEYIDEEENASLANQYDYYYVPCIYLNEKKVHEGVASKEIIEAIFKQVM